MDKKSNLDTTLNEYIIPPASEDLADRIILSAQNIPQKPNLWKLFSRICEEFKLPDPAIGFASLLLIGFTVGFTAYKSTSAYAAPENIMEELANDNEDLL